MRSKSAEKSAELSGAEQKTKNFQLLFVYVVGSGEKTTSKRIDLRTIINKT